MAERMFFNGTKTATRARTTISSTIESTPIGFSAGSSACLLSKKRFQWARRSRATMSSSSDSQKTISLFWDWRGNSATKLHVGRFRSIPPPNPVGQMRKGRNCVPWSATNPCNLRACGPWPTRNTGGSRLYPICLKWTTDYASVAPGSRESLHRRRRQSLSCSMIRVGRPAASYVSDRVNRDEQVLALDLTFFGDAWKENEPFSYAQILDGEGDRPLGLQAAQLLAIANWIRACAGAQKVRLESRGIRTQTIGLVAAALQPDLLSEVIVHEGMSSFDFLLQKPVTFDEAPELFCLDLYKDFDLHRLATIAAPAQVKLESLVKNAP